jgi:hypothetical protein
MTFPVIIKPAPPWAHEEYKFHKSRPGNCPSTAIFSSMAALAILLGIDWPFGKSSEANKSRPIGRPQGIKIRHLVLVSAPGTENGELMVTLMDKKREPGFASRCMGISISPKQLAATDPEPVYLGRRVN